MFILFTLGTAGFVAVGGFDEEGETHEEVVVPLGRVDVEIHGLAGAIVAPGLFHLRPEVTVFRRAVRGIYFETAGVDRRQQIEADFGFRGLGEELEKSGVSL